MSKSLNEKEVKHQEVRCTMITEHNDRIEGMNKEHHSQRQLLESKMTDLTDKHFVHA